MGPPILIISANDLFLLRNLGLLSKTQIGNDVTKGGPLGELVQWSDIIAALHAAGHRIFIVTGRDEIKEVWGKGALQMKS